MRDCRTSTVLLSESRRAKADNSRKNGVIRLNGASFSGEAGRRGGFEASSIVHI